VVKPERGRSFCVLGSCPREGALPQKYPPRRVARALDPLSLAGNGLPVLGGGHAWTPPFPPSRGVPRPCVLSFFRPMHRTRRRRAGLFGGRTSGRARMNFQRCNLIPKRKFLTIVLDQGGQSKSRSSRANDRRPLKWSSGALHSTSLSHVAASDAFTAKPDGCSIPKISTKMALDPPTTASAIAVVALAQWRRRAHRDASRIFADDPRWMPRPESRWPTFGTDGRSYLAQACGGAGRPYYYTMSSPPLIVRRLSSWSARR